MRLAKPIYDSNNRLLLNIGYKLSEPILQRISQLGISEIYIEPNQNIELQIKDVITDTTIKRTIAKIETMIKELEINNHQSNRINGHNQMLSVYSSVFHRLIQELRNNVSLVKLFDHILTSDHYVFEHSLNVTLYSLAIATKLGLDEDELYLIALGALLHDIGKTFVPSEVLYKTGKLTSDEFKEVQKHPEYGYQLIRNEHIHPVIAICALQHHEKLNGTGYPNNLKEKDIHLYAKILAIADVFDALTSNRVYRSAMPPQEALNLMIADSGTHFDSNILDVLVATIASLDFISNDLVDRVCVEPSFEPSQLSTKNLVS